MIDEVDTIPEELVAEYIEENIFTDVNFPVKRATIVGLTVKQCGALVEAHSADRDLVYLLGGDIIGTEWNGDWENKALERVVGLVGGRYNCVYGLVHLDKSAANSFCQVYQKRGKIRGGRQ